MLALQGKHIILGLTGGIACYKSAELLRRLQDQGAKVTVVMTPAATQFITPTTMQALSGQPVHLDTINPDMADSMAHIHLPRQADLILIAPASADFIAKISLGLANDLLSTLCLAKGDCPLAVAPAMNSQMWLHSATQRHIKQLEIDGVCVWGPNQGSQACGDHGPGRLLEPSELIAHTIAFFKPKILAGKKVLITAGPTEERIDPIRVITNRSSGKMGYALAESAVQAGAIVTLITGPTALTIPYGLQKTIHVRSGREMHQAVMSIAQEQDIFIAVAAVADWHISNAKEHKLKKDSFKKVGLDLEFSENPDILAEVAALTHGPYCVGFAAETENLSEHAQTKRLRKGVPILIGNLAQKVMDADNTQLIVFDKEGEHPLPPSSKSEAAEKLIQIIANNFKHNQ